MYSFSILLVALVFKSVQDIVSTESIITVKPQQCEENEEWTECAPVCPPQTCVSIFSLYSCDDSPACKPGCKCKDGFLRDGDNGTCILSEACPKPLPSCTENEEFIENNTKCEESCPIAVENATDFSSVSPARECPAYTGCVCKEGFVRDQNFSCISIDKCPPPQVCDGDHEFVNYCSSPCAATCKTRFRGDSQFCAAVCMTGCSCESGYFRHDNGTCVLEEACSPPSCNDDEEYIHNNTACEQSCETYNNTCIDCEYVRAEGCFCKRNTIRAAPWDLTCVEPVKCEPKSCPENEHYESCPPSCPPETCSIIWTRYSCSMKDDCCEPKCRCDEGYYRNEAGICITTQQCVDGRTKRSFTP